MYDALEHAKSCWSKRVLQFYSTMLHLLLTKLEGLAVCLHFFARNFVHHQGLMCFCIKLQYTPRHYVHTPGCACLLQLSVHNNIRKHAYMRAKAFAHLCINTAPADKSS